MDYWESRKSFWTTPKGFILQITLILVILGLAVVALNLYTSPFPVIESFEVKPTVINPKEAATLRWNVIGAAEIKIDHGIGNVLSMGTTQVTPFETVTYTLTAVNGTRNRTKSVKVIVR